MFVPGTALRRTLPVLAVRQPATVVSLSGCWYKSPAGVACVTDVNRTVPSGSHTLIVANTDCEVNVWFCVIPLIVSVGDRLSTTLTCTATLSEFSATTDGVACRY